MKKLQTAILLTVGIMSASTYAQTSAASPNQNSGQNSTMGTINNSTTVPLNGDAVKNPMEKYNSNSKSSSFATAAMEQTNSDQMNKDWMHKQWKTMSSTEKREYKEKYKIMWKNMTPEQKAEWKKDHAGETNYMDKKWYQTDKSR